MPLATISAPASGPPPSGGPPTGHADTAAPQGFADLVAAAVGDPAASRAAKATLAGTAAPVGIASPAGAPATEAVASDAKAPLPIPVPAPATAIVPAALPGAATVAAAEALSQGAVEPQPAPPGLPQAQSVPATAVTVPKIDISQVADASTRPPAAPQQAAAETAPVVVPAPVIASAKPKAAIVPDSKDGDKPDRGKEATPDVSIAATSLPDSAPQPQPQMAATPQPPVAPVAVQIVAVSPQRADDAEASVSASAGLPQSIAEAGTATPRAARAGTQAAALPEAPAAIPHQDNLPATLFSQALSQHAQPDQLLAGIAYAPDKTASSTAVVRAQAGEMGRDMGAVIARQLVDGREQVTVRLTPPDMGRVDVRLSFDHDKGLRAIVATETPAAMDLLRRDMGDLNRALADAGVRTDANSFRFDSRHSGSGFAQPDHGRQNPQGQSSAPSRQARAGLDGDPSADLAYRPLRASGGIDMIA